MKKVLLNDLEAGMVTAADVLTKGGQRILEKGRVLSRPSIMRLSFYNIKSVMVEGEPSPDDPTEEEPEQSAQQAYSQQIKASPRFQAFQTDHSIVLISVQNIFEGYVYHGVPLDLNALLSRVQELFRSCQTSLELFNMLHNMHSSDDSIYAHSLNVSLICRQIGKWLKVSPAETNLMTLSGLLCDIGKLKIPPEILNKPGKYTEEEFNMVKMHTRYGYDLLNPLPIDPHIKMAAMSHHERCDGSGYPMGIAQDEIDDYAIIVAIADVYDAMTTARSHRAPLCPFQVIDIFEKEGLQKYKPKYILPFLKHIASTYQNHRILLSDGRSGNIVMLNQQRLSRPIVQLDDGMCVDLSTSGDLHIQAVV